MNIGYACLLLGVPNTELKSCMMKNASADKLSEIIAHNLHALNGMIDYNILNNIMVFRISSNLIPFGSSPVNQLPWEKIFAREFSIIGEKIRKSGMRVSMHPGQYTIMNSPDRDVTARAAADLHYHNRVLEALGLTQEHKLILHIGGIYGDKSKAMERFAKAYQKLPLSIKSRLALENDDKLYTIKDVYDLAAWLQAPVVFDLLHHQVNPCEGDAETWINKCKSTWTAKDGRQKIHYAQQAVGKKPGAHSETIKAREFLSFYEMLQDKNIDVMLEVKDKNLSAVKCLHLASKSREINALEREWNRYQYLILEHAPDVYLKMEALLNSKKACSALPFYELIEHALEQKVAAQNAVNAAQCIWEYFKREASEKEQAVFFKKSQDLLNGKITNKKMIKFLWEMAVKYEKDHLLDSYYFTLPI